MDPNKKRRKYREDEDFRAHAIAYTKRYLAKYKGDPLFKELTSVRNRITARRNSIEAFTKKLEWLDKDLLQLVELKEQLAKQWKEKRRCNNAVIASSISTEFVSTTRHRNLL